MTDAFARMIDYLRETAAAARQIADRDLEAWLVIDTSAAEAAAGATASRTR